MRKLLLIALCLMSINCFALKDMFGNTVKESPKLEKQYNSWCGEMCDMDGSNCQSTCGPH